MKYSKVVQGKFLERPNRFIAKVEISTSGGKTKGKQTLIETVHVKNTGRCKELLIPGAKVWLDEPGTPGRKTRYDLIAVEKKGLGIVNIDSQAPNKAVKEWLQTQGYDYIKPEFTYGDSRIDFYMEKAGEEIGGHPGEKTLMEVKGCTLEVDGIGYFPDAPTERGIKHIRELTRAIQEGYRSVIAFVIQMEGIQEVRPNMSTHPEFGQALQEAKEAGVEVWFMLCSVKKNELKIEEVIR